MRQRFSGSVNSAKQCCGQDPRALTFSTTSSSILLGFQFFSLGKGAFVKEAALQAALQLSWKESLPVSPKIMHKEH